MIRGGALARRWVARAAVLGARAAARAGDVGAAAARSGRDACGVVTLPERVWSAADVCLPADDDASVLPLPAAGSLTRALTGRRTPSLDAFQPLGPRPAAAPAVLLMPVGAVAEGAWGVASAAERAARRCTEAEIAAGAPPLLTVLLTDPGSRAALLAALRAERGRDLAGVLVAVCPSPAAGAGRASDAAPGAASSSATGSARALAALGLVDAVLAPDPAALDPALIRLAARAGRTVTGPAGADRPVEALAAAGRAARLAALSPGEAAGPAVRAEPADHEAHARPTDPTGAAESAGTRASVTAEPRRAVVTGHDLKFAGALVERLRADGHEVRLDEWQGHARHNVERSRALAGWADVVHCEWSLGNLAWYSRHLDSPRRTTRLTSRLHLQEAATAFPARVRHDALDAWIFVAEHVRAQVLRDTRFPADRACVVPNAVTIPPQAPESAPARDHDDDRRFVLGLVGVLPERKGLHRALELLAALRREDPRYMLRIRGHHPDEVGWMAARPAAAAYYAAQLERIAADPLLAGAVTWDPHGPDMGAWYARVGVALSVSDFESFHFTLPDGAAHGCLPRSLAWAGADRLYPAAWLSPDVAALAASIRAATRDVAVWRAEADRAATLVAAAYDARRIGARLADVVLGVR